MQNTKVVRR